jgi:hypothetical protein
VSKTGDYDRDLAEERIRITQKIGRRGRDLNLSMDEIRAADEHAQALITQRESRKRLGK